MRKFDSIMAEWQQKGVSETSLELMVLIEELLVEKRKLEQEIVEIKKAASQPLEEYEVMVESVYQVRVKTAAISEEAAVEKVREQFLSGEIRIDGEDFAEYNLYVV